MSEQTFANNSAKTDEYLKKVNDTMIAMATVARDAKITGDDYILILQTMVAQVLASNDKKLEHKFRENLRKDTLNRRLYILRNPKTVAVQEASDVVN